MITRKHLKIFEVFAKMPFAPYTRQDVKKEAKEKSNNALALAINSLKKEDVIIEKKIGKSGILTLNLENDLTFHYLALCNNDRISNTIKQALESMKKELAETTPFYSIVIFGSHAIGKQTTDSDLDVAVFIDNKEDQKQMEASSNVAKLKSLLDMDIHIISRSETVEMLTSMDENLGKQIARKHLAVYNHRIFYEIIKEGMRYGFRI